jgi:hypothetical protein
MKKKVVKKIPKLHMKMDAFTEQLSNKKYYMMENANIEEILKELQEFDVSLK